MDPAAKMLLDHPLFLDARLMQASILEISNTNLGHASTIEREKSTFFVAKNLHPAHARPTPVTPGKQGSLPTHPIPIHIT